ncbi:Arylsulfotransferase (ASST) [Geosmithia morbida]|uniref:Arylsulfotransferase (ASST) n=1 Tax=Geosmithia morbida TaxID=1094350 RepID=A0A9P4Z3Y8_9HYPO|nr:Arylsulfotransferase (ASST) [Geosmithia morbida]KAF4126999.1 Arylsulfotransferase (ASST) [Geosmithia morbida]
MVSPVTVLMGVSAAAGAVSAADILSASSVDDFNRLVDESDGFPRQTFKSSAVVAPILHVNSWDRSLTDDSLYLFIGNNMHRAGAGAGPMIFDAADLSLVYADQTWDNSYHCEPRTIGGETHLTFWASGGGDVCVVVDSGYNVRYRLHAAAPHSNDMHDLDVTDQGTAVFTTHRTIPFDCTLWGGPGPDECLVHDTGFQELDMDTGEVVFEWFAADHWAPGDSHARYEAGDFGLDADRRGAYDLSHLNGARKTSGGHYLVSSRHYWHIQLVNGTSGDPIWTLGGNGNDFRDLSGGRATDFAWQHNPRFYRDESHITLFDNHAENQGDCGDDCHARGMLVEIDTDNMTARLVREYYHPGHLDSLAMGGMQIIESQPRGERSDESRFEGSGQGEPSEDRREGNAIVAWGWTPSFVEYTPDGRVAMDLQKGKVGVGRQADMFAYRVFKAPWSGKPSWPPSMAVEADGDEAVVYMSWNGATDVSSWNVYTTSSPIDQVTKFDPVASIPRDGFETSVVVSTDNLDRYVVVAALDRDGRILGTTSPFDVEQQQEETDSDSGPHQQSQTQQGTRTRHALSLGGAAVGLGLICVLSYSALYFYQRWRAAGGSVAKYGKYIPLRGSW